MKILVTDGNSRPALAICRSLGKKGHEVIVGDSSPWSLASKSRYCVEKCIYPDPALFPGTFIEFMLDYIEYNKIDFLIPVTDVTTIPLTDNMERIKKHCALPFSDYESIDRAADKVDIMQLAAGLSIDTPDSITIRHARDISEKDISFDYPVVLKPGRSRIMRDSGWLYTSVTYAYSFSDLKAQLEAMDLKVFPVMVQERINGPGLGIFMCFQDGQAIAAFSHRRLREKPPSGGVSVLRESTRLDPLAVEFSEKLLQALNWNGIAMVEYKVDQRDGRPKLMEINGRFWGSLQLAIDSGVDFPALLIESAQLPMVRNYTYKLGVKTRWLWGDIDALMMRLLKSDEELQLPPGSPSKVGYLVDFLKFWQPGLRYEVLKLSDIKPFMFETYQWLKNCFK